ncbi:MAG: endonuclease MutS2 [Clostridia bacterium]|nr:endonuclease MutS2 [Clostridia bacterium]
MINDKTLIKLEYARVLQLVAQRTRSALARNLVLETQPMSDCDTVAGLLAQTSEAIEYINNAVTPDYTFDDATIVLGKARVCSTLNLRELLCVMRLLRVSRQIRTLLNSYHNERIVWIAQKTDEIYTNHNLEELLDYSIISEEELNDKASDTLFSIRKKIKKVNADIREKLNSYTRSKDMAMYLQDAIVTMRGGRYVIPVKQEYKNYVKGLVHDQSASGSTLFIEPLAIVNLNNNLKTLLLEEAEEIERILVELTRMVNEVEKSLSNNQNIIALLDSVFARGLYAIDIKGVMPKVNDSGYVSLIRARHPLIDKHKVVPISISFGRGHSIVVVTGPNTGGKTVSLKTVGLFCIMASSGLYLPADDGTEISVFENIFCDIGDEQSIEQNLSTFSSHILNIKSITEQLNKQTLVLLDELGAGTEPNEGAAIALAITEYILNSGAKAVLTTHYGQLKEYSLVTEGIENACMEFDINTLAPTYKLIMGIPGSSNAIIIAQKLGLSRQIIASARDKISAEKITFEGVLQRAEQVRQASEQQKEEVESIKRELYEQLQKARAQNETLLVEREKLLKKSQLEVRQVVLQAQEEATELLNQLKEILNKKEYDDSTIFHARKIVKEIKDKKYVSQESEEDAVFVGDKVKIDMAKVGDDVYIKPLKNVGKIVKFEKKNRVLVQCGNMTTTVDADDLYESYDAGQSKKKYQPTKTTIRKQYVPSEINVLGQTVLEATDNVDKFLDDAVYAGLETVRVVHGIGTGKLRDGLHSYFGRHPHVAEYRLGVYGEGEGGVTIIKLK